MKENRTKGYSDLQMPPIEELGDESYYYNRNIRLTEVTHNDSAVEMWECERVPCTGTPTYDVTVDQIVKYYYPNGEDMAIMRKGIVDATNSEFINYNKFVEDVKKEVSEVFRTRRYI
ncbi:MAG: hypothetical protein ACRDDZ_05790 [Marinifilaceae bacterium]